MDPNAIDGFARRLEEVTEQQSNRGKTSAASLWRTILMVIGVVAVAQELRKAPDERTWHGKVADLVPYDFRPPTLDRFRQAFWNPDGPLVSGKAWGVGWVLNLGAVTRRLGGGR